MGSELAGPGVFPRIDYLHWIEGRTDAVTHDLGSSDLRGTGPLQEGPVPGKLQDLPDPDPAETDLAELVATEYGVDPDSVLLTAGATMANVLAMGAATKLAGGRPATGDDADDGDEPPDPRVLVEKPGYEPLRATPRGLGATVDRFRRPAGEDYRLDPDRIEAAVVEDTALTVVTNRHNPSGNLTDRETLAAAAGAARSEGGYLLVDEVYAPYVVDPPDGTSADDSGDAPGESGEGPDDRDGSGGPLDVIRGIVSSGAGTAFGGPTVAGVDGAVATGSLTKFHGLGGLRVGWLVADPEFVDAAGEVAAHVPALSTPGRVLGRRALAADEDLAAEARALLAENAALLDEFVAGRADLAGPVFEGASYAFLDHDRADGDAVAAAAEDRDLLVVPGRFFDDPDRFRVSLGRDPEDVAAALDVLGETLDAL